MQELTQRQRHVLDHIKAEIERVGRPPTVRELAKSFGVSSTNAVVNWLKALEKKGKIHRDHAASRGIIVLEREPRGIPLLSLEILSQCESY